MFKRLRERIAEEATKFPVGQLANNSGKPIQEAENKGTENNSSEDLITLSDSSSVVVPHTSPQQFSIGEEEDGSLSEQSTPQKKQNASSGDSNTHHGANSSGFTDTGFGQEYRPSKKLSYVPQSDIESEREDPPTLNLDGISKDQLMAAIQTLKARSYKYKNKYAEVVKNFKELREEKMKIENTLIENQDKGLRRIAELREQCQLEQKAKAHLEENLRLLLEEKDSRICVLETQINLLKEGGKSDNTKTLPEDCDNQLSDAGSGDTRSEDSFTSMSNDISVLQEKVERLQHQINQDKKTITAQKDQISLLRKQNENLSEELEEKVKRLNSIEDEQMKLKSEHESILKNMQNRLNELEKQQEESIMSMAETKRNMHEELELKEKQLIKAEEESKHYQAIAEREKEIVSELKRQQDEKIKELQHQLELTEKTLEDEKQSLLHELAQGKAAAISLMQQECAKKITAVEEEWKSKYEALESSVKKFSQVQVEESTHSLKCSEEKLKQAEEQVEQLSSLVRELEKENASLKNSVEKLESEIIQSSTNFEKMKVRYSDYDTLKEKESLLNEQETINRGLNDKLTKYINIEKELKTLCESLSRELNEKKGIIFDLDNEKNCLIEKIKAHEASQRELEVMCDNLKNEILSLNNNLKNQSCKMEDAVLENNVKSEEIHKLKERIKEAEVHEKLAFEKLNMNLVEIREFEMENAELLSSNRLLCDENENLKCSLYSKKKELLSANDRISSAMEEIQLLNEALDSKECMFKQAMVSYKAVECIVSSLEDQQASLKSDLKHFKNICETLCKKFSNLYENLDTISVNNCIVYEFENSSNNNKSANLLNIESKVCTENLKSFSPVENDNFIKSHTECSAEKSLHSENEKNFDYENKQSLVEMISILKCENTNLKAEISAYKTAAELQDVEFAKNITILQQSLSDLQEERNNLSLVLQSIEKSQSDNENCTVTEETVKEKKADNDKSYNYNWEIKIAELNSKVKSEIEALSSQTEIVNKEFKSLRKQFLSNQDTCSEKLMQLNSKLLFRTEALINLKEELDSSVENAKCLKELLEKAKLELDVKSNLVSSLEKDKRELENKLKILKQDYCKKECELKETHKSQLIDLKEQTKFTIEKLHDQIKKSNQQLEDTKIERFNAEKEYVKKNSDLMKQLENMSSIKEEMSKFLELNNLFEVKLFDPISKLDVYSSKIFSLTEKVCKFGFKLKMKDEKILQQNNTILDLKKAVESYSELHKNFTNVQNELNSTSQLLNEARKELADEKDKLSSTNSDVNDLQISLNSKIQELKLLEENYHQTVSHLNCREEELQALQEKYILATNDIERLNKLLNEEKIQSKELNSTLSELSHKYKNLTLSIDNISAEFKQHMENTNALLIVKTNQIENIETKLSSVSLDYESKANEIHDLKSKLSASLEELEETKLILKQEKEKLKSLDIVACEWKSKYEDSVKKFNNAKSTLADLEVEVENLKLQVEKVPNIQDNFDKSLKDLQDCQECLNRQLKKTADLEKEKQQLELMCMNLSEKLNNSNNEKVDLETKFNENLEMNQNKLQEWEGKYNDLILRVTNLEEEKQKLELENNEKTDRLKFLENDIQEVKLKCDMQDKKIRTAESEKHELELTCNIHTDRLKNLETEKQELQSSYNKEIEKLKALENKNSKLVQEYKELIEKFKALGKEKRELELKFNEQSEMLKIMEKEKQKWEQKYCEEIKPLKDAENERQEWALKCNEQTEMLKALEEEKRELIREHDEQKKKLTTIENEKNECELKHSIALKDLHNACNLTQKNKETIEKLLNEIEVKNKQIRSMVTSEELNKLKQNLELKIQKHSNLAESLQSKVNALLQSIAEKDIAIKNIETDKENIEARHEESLKCMKDKLQNAEKNYKTQIEELKLKINQLEKENSILISEKENLLIVQNQLKDLKSGEEKVQSELKSKEEELKVLKEKLDTSNKEQVEKIHTFQENMKDKENMILKLKTNIESISKEHKESIEEFQKKIKWLEVEREQLMLQAQERVSATEAKCREDIKSLHEKCEKLLQENSEIEKLRNQLNAAELNEVAANKKVALLKEELSSVEKKLAELVYSRQISESEWSSKLEKLVEENRILLNNNDHVERLKSEKEELNEKLKSAVQQVNKINILQAERDLFQKEKEELSKELNQQKMLQNVSTDKLKSLEAEKMTMKEKIEELSCENEKLKADILDLKNSFKSEKDNLLLEKEKLLNQIQQLESCVSDPQNTSVQNYVETLKKEYETAIKAKDDDMLTKLKQLVKDFSIQMDLKDKDSEQTIAELMEKNEYIETKLQREYSVQIEGLREDLQEKMCALDEMRDSYEEAIQEKDTKIKELEAAVKCLSSKDNSGTDSFHGTSEPSDWDDTWVVPDEVAENSSPSHGNKTCDEHMKQIELLQEELSKCNSEIKELKVLLRLSPPDTMVNNNNRRDSLQSLPEPTEFEYLKNIIYEYMMGKEPVTLVKVIAAVLRFNDVQTQQVIRREEARHQTR